MQLGLGREDKITDPTWDDVLRHIELSPFLILSDEDRFMQCLYCGDEYRIEYSNGDLSKLQHCMVDIKQALKLLRSFHDGRDPNQAAAEWKPTKIPGKWDKRDKVVFLILWVLLLLLLGGTLWTFFL
jgi:hypothetical protein